VNKVLDFGVLGASSSRNQGMSPQGVSSFSHDAICAITYVSQIQTSCEDT